MFLTNTKPTGVGENFKQTRMQPSVGLVFVQINSFFLFNWTYFGLINLPYLVDIMMCCSYFYLRSKSKFIYLFFSIMSILVIYIRKIYKLI